VGRLVLRATAFTHDGAVREHNEDTIALGEWVESGSMVAPKVIERPLAAPLLALVADGMGGHAAGELASRAAAEYLVRESARAVDEAALAQLLHEAHRELFALMAEQPAVQGMGTTVAGVALTGGSAIVFNVGDSRVFGLGEGRLEQLSTDDTPGPKQADGRKAVRRSNLITQTLGGFAPEPIEPHLRAQPLGLGAGWLICSDGLSDVVEDDEMAALIGDDDAASVVALFETAMDRGGRDNVSIMLLRIGEESEGRC
jgi:PPM family protein phosphatase